MTQQINDAPIVIGTRGSALAMAQTGWVRDRIQERFPDLELSIKVIKTSADKNQTQSLRSSSSVGVFVKELEQAMIRGEIDLAVHSMKDVPSSLAPGLRFAAVPEREDARDAFIANHARSLADLPSRARIGTGSLRRQAQLLALRPDLEILDIRGNVDTRLKKLAEGTYDAVILACAGLNRLGLQDRTTASFEYAQMLPAPGQAALALEIREDDARTLAIASALDHAATHISIIAERRFLELMGGGCNVPVAVYARISRDMMKIDGLVASPDGTEIIRDSITQNPAKALEAVESLAKNILERGGRAILDSL